jgi:hypothetical protein
MIPAYDTPDFLDESQSLHGARQLSSILLQVQDRFLFFIVMQGLACRRPVAVTPAV